MEDCAPGRRARAVDTMDARGLCMIGFGLAAVVEDLRSRSISNWTSGGALIAGLAFHTVNTGLPGLGHAALGTLIGFGVFLVFYLLGGMGGGDVKLMAGFGALLGASSIVQAALFTALCGGVMAVLYLAFRGVWRKLGPPRPASGSDPADKKAADCIPYAPAIALGAWLALLIEI